MASAEEQLLGLERNRPPHFAGRVHELQVLHDYLAYIRRTDDPTGGMVLIDGVQGVGKTQLVAEFVRRAKEADANVHHLPLVVADIPTDAKPLFTMLSRQLQRPVAGLSAALDRVREVGIGIAKIRIGSEARQSLGSLLAGSARAGRWRDQARHAGHCRSRARSSVNRRCKPHTILREPADGHGAARRHAPCCRGDGRWTRPQPVSPRRDSSSDGASAIYGGRGGSAALRH